ncbi:SAS complex subunit [Exophiala dermatitidis]|uniref:histone acetyltransferase n=2 Tax=Exophiala dermatitidis TaxID=5970 RepID=H6BX60_EXODN|nr:histone acetyltransferase [Exophiala dermatitidis NIH/UT8656]KAJ4503726.1 SAS complex subunit [Exophiala dermatitidis]EHY55346.1 histone acetyltransferase [Exophiala dermatitidis NIH/UT8656]KAJ4508320.1 SAS complex subunit [Exophiala dermatitidis]KAJ4533464.1 SAS complex subunit [Exophiala dermatitidis]KAJ4538348.1 SAS complex subunit [Exophiala dermatitidis]
MPSAIDNMSVLQEGSPHHHRSRRASLKVLNRNIGQVVLGNLLFDTWYYSPYPDSIILGPEHQHHAAGKQQQHVFGGSSTAAELRNGAAARGGLASMLATISSEPLCRRLYVCPRCFRYTPVENDYVLHLQHHQERRDQGLETQPVPESAYKVYDWQGYAVWEIDGEKEKLYCQNLSLFGKLFLEQKSVFFDTAGFKYYVLTHTPSRASTAPTTKGRGRKRSSSVFEDDVLDESHVLGFFSKEDLSWDCNNLACILIFPPFQHRQLGQLLMAVSYKLSGWEWEGGVIGGPEKPLSAMGRRSYLRFWSERIARFMMGQTADADAKRVFHSAKKTTTAHPRKEEMTVKDIGNRTGMLGEDVVAALTEMGICQVMLPRRKKTVAGELNGVASHGHSESEELATMIIHRSKIVAWAEEHGVDLASPVPEEGFRGEWALSDLDRSGNSSESTGNEDDNSDAT